ncbi:MAG TPA: amidase [Chitinophagaceae bacterium]|nr:amidase [Chitinophagaceae bacterium]
MARCVNLLWYSFFCLLAGLQAGIVFQAGGQDKLITPAEIASSEHLIGLRFSPAERDSMIMGLKDNLKTIEHFHRMTLGNSLPMALDFDPLLPGMHPPSRQLPIDWNIPQHVPLPANKNDLAFYSILQLASLIRHKQITSLELTRFFLKRLRKYGDTLHCVISLTKNIALVQAREADSDLAHGIYRSPLQGIPYGLKDLFAVKGTRTTWGTPPYRDQVLDQNAFVYQQLRKAGAVLVAKLSMGELAMDDVWFGGLTRDPWDLQKGSSGSSAGPAAATAAGLVPFAIGTETWGSIVAPSAVCGVTGLRPTFGSISRSGAMTLAWSSDKIGPICRSAEDAAVVFAAIHGTDGLDRSARNIPFNYQENLPLSRARIAFAANYIDTLPDSSPEKRVIRELRHLGARPEPVVFPDTLPADPVLAIIVNAESAAAFDRLTRSHRDSLMTQQSRNSWPNLFRVSRFIPAVEYIQACRFRYQIMQQAARLLEKFDVIVVPTFAGNQLALTNLTGNPVVVMPDGFDVNGLPQSITFIGKLYGEASLLAIARAYQNGTNYNKKHPALFR